MPGPQPPPLELSDRQRAILEQLKRAQTNPHRLVQRASLILTMAEEVNPQPAAHQERRDRETARVWRRRWFAAGPHLATAEAQGCSDKAFRALIETVLEDAARPGTPATFTAEQLTQVVALACEDPAGSGRPISHWTPRELADELIKRKIVPRISVRHGGRFLKGTGIAAASQSRLVERGTERPARVCGAGQPNRCALGANSALA